MEHNWGKKWSIAQKHNRLKPTGSYTMAGSYTMVAKGVNARYTTPLKTVCKAISMPEGVKEVNWPLRLL